MDSIRLRTRRVTEPYGSTSDGRANAMIDLRGHNHVAIALPYRALHSVAFHPTDGITMEFRDHKVRVRGRNLRDLYDLLVAHRVTYVQEDDFDAEPESATFIDAIIVERVQDVV